MPWALNREIVDKWLTRSKPGDQLVYARSTGPLPHSDGVKALREAFDDGRIAFKQKRNGDFDLSFMAERLADPKRPTRALRLARPAPSEDDDEIAMLMAVLRRKAARNELMGTNRELGEAIGCAGPDRVAYLLRKQITAGRLTVEAAAIGCRVATIMATGKRTAVGR